MSNVGQGALIVVGTIVGAYFGNPQLGFVLGSLAGSALFPTQLPGQFGPKLTDNQTTTSVIGSPVPILFGTASVAGCYMWTGPIVQTQSTASTGGKGGPQQDNTTFDYNQSVAVGLCEGPIGGVSRIWENGLLVYDIRPQLTTETDAEYAARLTVAAEYADTFVLHLGDEDQVADSTIEGIEGFGNVPAFRGLAYIVWPGRKLQPTQGLRHPTFKFEAFQSGTGACEDSSPFSAGRLFKWNAAGGLDPRPSEGSTQSYVYQYWGDISGGVVRPGEVTTLDAAIASAINLDGTPLTLPPHCYGWNTDSGVTQTLSPYDSISADLVEPLAEQWNVYMFFNATVPAEIMDTDVPGGVLGACSFIHAQSAPLWWHGKIDGAVLFGHGVYTFGLTPGTGQFNCGPFDDAVGFQKDVPIRVQRNPGPPINPCDGLLPSPTPGYCIRGDGKYVRANTWTHAPAQRYHVLRGFGTADDQVVSYPLDPLVPISDPNYDNEAFWVAAYNAAVATGDIASGLVYGTNYPQEQTEQYAWTIEMQVCEGSGADVSVGSIIRAICTRAGFTSDQVDASDMDAVFVNGYAVGSISAARDILSPLRSVGFFDCVESGTQLVFRARGKDIVASLSSDDFGAFDSQQGSIPPRLTTTKAQDEDLPLQVRVHYFATSRDYEDGEALSPQRQTTRSVNVVDVDLAVCIDDTQALQIAEVIWADSWAERWGHTLSVDQGQWELEPGDCIEIPVDDVTRRLRIVSDTTSSGVLRALTCVRDDDSAYISHAVAEAPFRKPQKLKLLRQTDLVLLDLPALVDADNDAGLYAAARGNPSAGDAWNGCIVYRSTDGGATFSQLAGLTSATPMGSVHTAVPSSDWHAWDNSTVITVDVPAGVTFESRSDSSVLTGANAAAMGADGRWEIVQFANATQVSSTQWHLSRLLRGRRGTEHNIGSSQTGDRFVMVSTGTMVRLPLQTTEIGAVRTYKAVSIGTSYATGVDQTFSGHAVALRPFSPVLPAAHRATDDDILISWTRRGRLGRTLMSGVDIPLSEASESYSIDIYTLDSPHTIVRTLTSSVPYVLYTAAQQATDFGSDSADRMLIAVYQISATVGRGYPDFQLLTIT